MNDLKYKKAFTLVELIIVITILVILATIAFVSFQNYTRDTRDSNRLITINNISKGLEAFQIKTGFYPEPENSIEITASGTIINKQGYFGETQSNIINIDKLPLDPLDGTKYIYSINNNKNKYQILSYLEANSQLSFVNEAYANDLINRNINTSGNKLGIVLSEKNEIITQSVDIITSTGVYKIIVDNSLSGTFIGTGEILKKSIVYSVPKNLKSCKDIIENYLQTKNIDGIYTISKENNDFFDVYCDMTTDGGGWTLMIKADGSKSTFTYNSNYWTNNILLNSDSLIINNEEFKGNGFSEMSFGKILLILDTNGSKKSISIDVKGNSLFSLFNGPYIKTNISKNSWMSIVNDSSLQPYCNKEGINVISTSNYTKARIGISSNNENDCFTSDSSLGIGMSSSVTVGNICSSTFCSGGVLSPYSINSFGYIFIK